MSEHEDVWIITDSKQSAESLVKLEFSDIVDAARELRLEPVLERITVQIYNKEMYEKICNVYEFPCFIFTLYEYRNGNIESFPDICRFCIYNDIKFITMWDYLATSEVMEIAKQYGIKVYVHTVNNKELVEKLGKLGVTGFYTDYITPEELKEI